MKLYYYWHRFAVVIALWLIKGNLCVPAIRPLSQRGIIYPVENWDDCFLDDASTQPGLCKTLADCPDVLKKWDKENIYPKTCYFIKKEQFVCCPLAAVTTELSTVKDTDTNNNNNNFIDLHMVEETPELPTTVVTELPTVPLQPFTDNINNSNNDELLTQIFIRRSELECELHQTFEQTVVNGEPTKPNEFPFMAALGWVSNVDNTVWYRCGGALISSKFVITAAHCAEIGGDSPTVVRIGGSNLTESDIQNIRIKKIITHPGYNTTSIYNDIALVELDQEINKPIACLWSTFDLDKTNLIALGYGHTRFGGLASNQLLKAALSAVTKLECEKYYQLDADLRPMGIVDSHLCAGDPEKLRDTCQGDSGGPLIMDFGKVSYLVGVTSFGLGCSGEPPSIYTRVSSYIDWIEDIVWPKIDVRFN